MLQYVPYIEYHSVGLPYGTLVTKFIEASSVRLDDYVFSNSKSASITVARVMKLSNTYNARRDRIHDAEEDAPDKHLRIGARPCNNVLDVILDSDDESNSGEGLFVSEYR
ncbi:unnamed protein product [Linum trigynum]|uniref:Uncharacterized protein n=1 Tax=Linum trigynum TaxID=586398 RepID=A0AAV2E7P7_9ROSI